MKCILFLILLTTSSYVLADGALIIRGRVPASFTVDSSSEGGPTLKTNSKSKSLAPKMVMSEFKKHTVITVIQR